MDPLTWVIWGAIMYVLIKIAGHVFGTAPPPPPPMVDIGVSTYDLAQQVKAMTSPEVWAKLRADTPDPLPPHTSIVNVAVPVPTPEVHVHVGGEGAAEPPTVQEGEIFFAPGEPQSFATFEGQQHITELLELQLGGLATPTDMIRPQLFRGIAGMGKTLIAKVTAAEHRRRDRRLGLTVGLWIEVFPESFKDLDTIMRLVLDHPRSTLFFDEIHMLEEDESVRLYELLANGRYQFRGHTQATQMPPTLVLGATTDYGRLHSALKRRFRNHDFRPATPVELEAIFARRVTLPVAPGVLAQVVERTHHSGAPWEGLQILQLAEDHVRFRQRATLTSDDVTRIFTLFEMDALGLTAVDRRVVTALLGQPKYRNVRGGGKEFVCYAASEHNTCMLAQLDKTEYREVVRPRLMSRGLLALVPYYGQALTPRAVEQYRSLVPAA